MRKTILAAAALLALPAVALSQDETKRMVEQPIKEAISPVTTLVAPGKMTWHASFDDAVAAAKKSGKAVLLFQLLGRLDQEFC